MDPAVYQNFEKDDRWTAVDDYAFEHLHPKSEPYHEALDYALKLQLSSGLPDIAVSPLQGKFLAVQCKLLGSRHVLEIGTLGGYSTIWFASAHPDVKITTIDYKEEHAVVARKAFEHAGVADRIEVIVGKGVDILPRLKEEIDAGKRPRYDFVFADADKPSNPTYLNQSIDMVRKGACIIVDNVVRKGKLASIEAANEDPAVKGSREVVEQAGRDERIDCTVLQTVGEKNYDGFLICVVK